MTKMKNRLLSKMFCLAALVMLMPLHGLLAAGTGQDVRISLDRQNVPLGKLLDEIETMSGYTVLVRTGNLDLGETFSLNVQDKTLDEVFGTLFKDKGIRYTIADKRVSIFRPTDPPAAPQAASNRVTITGKVTDPTGAPLSGVVVSVPGTAFGTATNTDGRYSLSVPADAQVLAFNYFGMTPVEVAIDSRSVIDAILEPNVIAVDEVVVTALGIRKEAKSLSYHVQQVAGESVTKIADANFVNNLNGRVAGVTINASSSGTGGSSRVVMRGTKSISLNNSVLYVVDGIPMSNLSNEGPADIFSGAAQSGDGISHINADDIESISALTGPSAAALYGSEGANGVVLVTTKKGSKERISVSLSNSTIFSTPLVLPKFQNTYGPSESGSYFSWGEKLETPSNYRPADFFQTGVNYTNNVSFSVGTERNQTYVSLGAVNSSGIIHNNDYDRYNFAVRNTTSFLKDKMTLDVRFMGSFVTEQNMLAQGQYHNPLVPVYLFPPGDDFSKVEVYQRYDPARVLQTQFWPYDAGFAMQNPYWITNKILNTNHKRRWTGNATLSYDILSWLNITGRIRIDDSNERYEIRRYAGTSAPLFASKYGYYQKRNRTNLNIYGDVILGVNKDVGNFNIIANVGGSFDDINHQTDVLGGDLLGTANGFTFANTDDRLKSQSGSYKRHKQSVFATAQLGYKDMVYLDASVRTDWSSTFAGTNTSSMTYPSVGLSAIVSEMIPGMTKNNILSFLRLRASYTEVGNEPFHYLTIPTYPYGSGGRLITATRMHNPNLKPEHTRSWEAGLNMFMFGKRVNVDVTFYTSSTYNQYFEPEISPARHKGRTSVVLNAGRVDNKGVELAVGYKDRAGDFSWNPYMTFTHNRNKIVELLRPTEIDGEVVSLKELNMGGTDSYRMVLKEGGSMGDIYVNTLKVDEHGDIYVHPTAQTVQSAPGVFVYAGTSDPKYNISAGTSLGWKGLTLDIMFTGRIGGIVVSNTQAILDRFGVSKSSADARDAGGVLVNGRPIPAQSYYEEVGGGTSGIGSMYVYSATNWRLNELSLSYDLPVQNWCKWLKGASISLVGRNLFVMYLKAPFDPQIAANTGTYYQGIDYFMTPSQRNIGFSIKLKF